MHEDTPGDEQDQKIQSSGEHVPLHTVTYKTRTRNQYSQALIYRVKDECNHQTCWHSMQS